MNKTTSTLLISSALLATSAVAGVPLNGLQGDGGIAFNPVAFVAGTYAEESQTISAPQVGTWYTRLDSADIDWAAASASFSIEKRLELSYGYGWTDANKYGDDSVSTHNLGLKLNVLPDGSFDAKWFPAVSAGAIYKHTDAATADALGLDKDGADFYAVATKLVGDAPVPILLSAGVLYSDEVVNGVVGHGDYGFGWFVTDDYYYHTGNTELYYAIDIFNRKHDMKIIGLSNVNNTELQRAGLNIMSAVENELFPSSNKKRNGD